MTKQYIFKSERLGFRNWMDTDILPMSKISADPIVMEYFPSTQSYTHTEGFIRRMQKEFLEKGFCYFAVDKLSDGKLIGFIGISEQTFESDFIPCVDIGWRLSKDDWGNGYATEGAKRCLMFAFSDIGLKNIKSICPFINDKSEHVMKKLGMIKTKTFNHPLLKDYKDLEQCVLYEINNDQFRLHQK